MDVHTISDLDKESNRQEKVFESLLLFDTCESQSLHPNILFYMIVVQVINLPGIIFMISGDLREEMIAPLYKLRLGSAPSSKGISCAKAQGANHGIFDTVLSL